MQLAYDLHFVQCRPNYDIKPNKCLILKLEITLATF